MCSDSLFAAGFSTFWHAKRKAQKKRIAETPENGDNDEGDVLALPSEQVDENHVAAQQSGASESQDSHVVAERIQPNDALHVVEEQTQPSKHVDNLAELFKDQSPPNASDLKKYAENQGWTYSRTENGPIKYIDENGIVRMTIKRGSSRALGSANPHVELRDSSGQRIDPQGNPVTRKSTGNHSPINYDL